MRSNRLDSLALEFRSPGPAHRPLQIVHGLDAFVGANGAPGLEGLDRTLGTLKEIGVGGIVTNVSFKGYMKDERQWDILRHGIKAARDLGLAVWIYDEDGYPSGAAGGLVLDGHPEMEALGIACITVKVSGPAPLSVDAPDCLLHFVGAEAFDGDAAIDLSGSVDASGRLRADLPAGAWTVQYFFEKAAYEGTHAEKNVYASRRYINVLDPAAVRRFIEVTHAAYERELGPGLGGASAFFTDEPSLMASYVWPLPAGVETPRIQDALSSRDRSPMVAWSRGFAAEFERRKGYDIATLLSDLFVDRHPRSRAIREDYREVAGALFADAYFGTIGDWCAARGLESSGHVLVEENVIWHTAFLGDLFALARRLSIPGIDMLDSDPRSILSGEGFMVPKQVSSAAHLAGRRLVMSETSDWFQRNAGRAATAVELRGTTNLQYLLGVTTITSYHDWAGRGDGYKDFLDHAARLNLMLTCGHHDARVGVLYPIRAVAGRFLPQSEAPLAVTQSADVRAMAAGWTDTCRVLLTAQADFDCIDEQALEKGIIRGGALRAGRERYDVIVLPPMDRIGAPALAALARFMRRGGMVVVVRDAAVPRLEGLPQRHRNLTEVEAAAGLAALDGRALPRVVRLRRPTADLLCARHETPVGALYFLVNTSASPITVEASFPDSGDCRAWDPQSGGVLPARSCRPGDWTPLTIEGDGALFLSFSRSSRHRRWQGSAESRTRGGPRPPGGDSG